MEMKSKFTKSAAWLAVLAVSAGAHANLIVNGDFENQPNFGINGDGSYTRLDPGQMPGWTIASGHSVTIHKNPGAYPTISGAYSVNTDGEGQNGHNADFYQDFATSAGVSYTLDYNWLGWMASGAVLDVRIEVASSGAIVVQDLQNWDNLGVHHRQLSFVGDGTDYRLRILENPESGFNDNSYIVDDFSVEAVPEPATLAIAGLAAAALLRKRK